MRFKKKTDGGLIATGKNVDERYRVHIVRRVRRDMTMTPDDYHATVTRYSDGLELIFISKRKRVLKLRTRRIFLDHEFKMYDKRQKKLEETEDFVR